MAEYTVFMSRQGATAAVTGFLEKKEAVAYLRNNGFEWSPEVKCWEQTFATVDPYSDESDKLYNYATIMQGSGVGIAG